MFALYAQDTFDEDTVIEQLKTLEDLSTKVDEASRSKISKFLEKINSIRKFITKPSELKDEQISFSIRSNKRNKRYIN